MFTKENYAGRENLSASVIASRVGVKSMDIEYNSGPVGETGNGSRFLKAFAAELRSGSAVRDLVNIGLGSMITWLSAKIAVKPRYAGLAGILAGLLHIGLYGLIMKVVLRVSRSLASEKQNVKKMNSRVNLGSASKVSMIFLGLAVFFGFLFIAQNIILPVVYACIIAIVLKPIVQWFERRGMHRIIAITCTLLLLLVVSTSVVIILSLQVLQFSDSFPALVQKFHSMLEQAIAWGSETFNISTAKIHLWVTDKRAEMMSGSGAAIGRTLVGTGNLLVVIVLIPVYVFMILFYQPLLVQFIHRLFSPQSRTEVNDVLTAIRKIIQSYLAGLLMEAGIVAVLNSTALLVLGIDYAILLGVIGAILNVIPYIGGLIAVALPMLIALATKSSGWYPLLVVMAYVVIQFIDNHYIIPKVVASKVKVNALVSVVVVLAGGLLWGVPGMFLSIPLTAVIKVIFDHIEPLKPWGYLLGDTMPVVRIFRLPALPFAKMNKN